MAGKTSGTAEQQWRDRLQRWRDSGQSVREFCWQEGVGERRVVAFGLVAVGFGELSQRGGEGIGLADAASDLGDVAGAGQQAR
jgi:hypothetical protein